LLIAAHFVNESVISPFAYYYCPPFTQDTKGEQHVRLHWQHARKIQYVIFPRRLQRRRHIMSKEDEEWSRARPFDIFSGTFSRSLRGGGARNLIYSFPVVSPSFHLSSPGGARLQLMTAAEVVGILYISFHTRYWLLLLIKRSPDAGTFFPSLFPDNFSREYFGEADDARELRSSFLERAYAYSLFIEGRPPFLFKSQDSNPSFPRISRGFLTCAKAALVARSPF